MGNAENLILALNSSSVYSEARFFVTIFSEVSDVVEVWFLVGYDE